ncbi:MAG: hypothetical protein LIR46_07790 [Bacteroidota bacterium]|nr:hypothetical protein [Bacteroidota bacterium]
MNITNEMCNWLSEHEVAYERNAVEKIKNEWEMNKADLLEKFRKHPNWSEDNLAIVFKESEYERPLNPKAIEKFNDWAEKIMRKKVKEISRKEEYMKAYLKKEKYADAKYYLRNSCFDGMNLMINGEPARTVLSEKYNEEYDKFQEIEKVTTQIFGERIDIETERKYRRVINALRDFQTVESNFATEELAEKVNNRIPEIEAVAGQKISRIIQKICKTIDLDKYVEINDYGTYTRDDGYNREYAILCNDINPIKYKRITVISLNPIDYWSMSHGYNWKSCHYVGDDDDGCYSSGTESYMLDSTSVIYYIIDERYEGTDYCKQKKINRAVFCIGEEGNAILEARVYPDDRDGGDNSLGKQFRDVMSKVISEIYNVNNYWSIVKGSSECHERTRSYGTHYRDYVEYSNGVMMINKSYNGEVCIEIGHDPICPVCGDEHSETENIVCSDCLNETRYSNPQTCARCGDRFDADDEGIETEDGTWYCCISCAEEDGYRRDINGNWYPEDELYYCEDEGEYCLEDECYMDDYDECYYSGTPYITTVDGNNYSDEDNAESDGYVEVNGEWIHEEDTIEIDGEIYSREDEDLVWINDDKAFRSEEDAENAGYVKLENEEWVSRTEATYDEENGTWRIIA